MYAVLLPLALTAIVCLLEAWERMVYWCCSEFDGNKIYRFRPYRPQNFFTVSASCWL